MPQYYLIIEKDRSESWVEAIKKYDGTNEWKLASFRSSEVEYFRQAIYPQEREEIREWASMADEKRPTWLGNVYFIPHKEPRNAAEYGWSALDFFSVDAQNPILDEFRAKLVESARREAEIEKMRSNSQYMANTFGKRDSRDLSRVEIMLRKIEIMDESQLEELLVSKEFSRSPESIKSKISERYLELQKID